MDVSSLLQLPEELLYLWHNHRAEILLSAGILVAVVRLARFWRSRRQEKEVLTPPLLTPTDEKEPAIGTSLKEQWTQTGHYNTQPRAAKASTRPKVAPKRVTGTKRTIGAPRAANEEIDTIQPVIFYYSLGGSTEARARDHIANRFGTDPGSAILPPQLHSLTEIDFEDNFVSLPSATSKNVTLFYILLVPSYDIDTELSNFIQNLQETHHDFRIETAPLSGVAGYSVFGFGDRQEWPSEAEGFCSQAVEVDKWMAKLTGRKRAFPLGLGDVRGDVQERMQEWVEGVENVMKDLATGKGLGEGVPGSGAAEESADEEEQEDFDDTAEELSKITQRPSARRTATSDLEDLRAPIPVDFTTSRPSSSTLSVSTPKPMVPPKSPTHIALTKQGYTIVGSHSGVKICRWTKSALRGRGSCYKYSFYGIASHLCMEATPSLSCSNKCVFCWRHGTNPVGTTWRWTVDPPDLIFAGMKAGHYSKIKMLKGVPGVRAERFAEAMRIKHCALSLVGEPIFYPHINELLAMLHAEHISTFLVCNAQHPAQLKALGPVTQLYVSIDASNKESLRAIDRPLHRDYWERFIACMDILREKRFTHRTVFRLTLVKGFNVDEEAAGYADLVERARPCFVEIKGVTFCGTSTATGAGLTMQNVPFYEEVTDFVLKLEAELKSRGLDYGIGAEHAHSCCVLLADRSRFFRKVEGEQKGRWHTRIDYAQFFRCLESGETFAPEDYVDAEPTPDWASWGKGGFDPRDVRVDRKGRPKVEEA